MMIIKEVECGSCLNKSKLTDYVINPYTGCQHGCRYCYADFMKRFRNVTEPWGEFVHPKVNCPGLLEKELESNKPGYILLSSVTDPYQPVEGKYGLTRRILETIKSHGGGYEVGILTKSALVRRDFNILSGMNTEVGCSINTLDGSAAMVTEPLASPPAERIKALKDAKERGVRVYGFISPVLPGITDLRELFRELSFCDYVWVEVLNTKPSVLARMRPVYMDSFSQHLVSLEDYVINKTAWLGRIRDEANALGKEFGLLVREVVSH